MIATSHYFARYRNDFGSAYDMYHYRDDATTFADEHGTIWHRVAVTAHRYYSPERAREELNAFEAEALLLQLETLDEHDDDTTFRRKLGELGYEAVSDDNGWYLVKEGASK